LSEPRRAMLIVGGDPYHDPWLCGLTIARYISEAGFEVLVSSAKEVLSSPELKGFSLLASYSPGRLTEAQTKGLLDFVRSGGGFLGIHPAAVVGEGAEEYLDMLGCKFLSHPPIGELEVKVVDKEHPVTLGLSDFRIVDELYLTDFDPSKLRILAISEHEGREYPMVYVKGFGEGRVCYIALGHDMRAVGSKDFKRLVVRGARWAAGIER